MSGQVFYKPYNGAGGEKKKKGILMEVVGKRSEILKKGTFTPGVLVEKTNQVLRSVTRLRMTRTVPVGQCENDARKYAVGPGRWSRFDGVLKDIKRRLTLVFQTIDQDVGLVKCAPMVGPMAKHLKIPDLF